MNNMSDSAQNILRHQAKTYTRDQKLALRCEG